MALEQGVERPAKKESEAKEKRAERAACLGLAANTRPAGRKRSPPGRRPDDAVPVVRQQVELVDAKSRRR